MKADVDETVYSVTDRETGEEFVVDDNGQIEGPEDVIRRLGENVRRVTPLEETADPDDEPDDEPDETLCGVNGCERSVKNPDDTCWQHE
jgi:hypothetical protein